MPAVSSRRLSITARLTIAFSIVVIFVAALYSAAAMWTLETTETLLVSEFLTDDLDHALEALESGKPVPRQPNVKLYGTGLLSLTVKNGEKPCPARVPACFSTVRKLL